MSEKIKVGVLSHAGGAHVGAYLLALATADDCAEVLLADPDGRWEPEARKKLGAKLTHVFRNYDELFAQQPEMVLVSMEAKLAPPVIDAALEAGCHVFAEKPSCVRSDDFVRLVQKADSKHRHLMLALANRTTPEIVKAKQLVEAGQIGKIYGVEMHLIADQTRLTRPSYHKKWFAHKDRAGGGYLIWLGIHWLDLAMYVTQSGIVDVGGQPSDIEDAATAAFRFENGSLGTITSGYFLDKRYHSHIKIWGSAGWMLIESMKEMPLQWYSTKGDKAGTIQKFSDSKNPRGYTPFVQAAVTAVAKKSDPPISNADSLRALKTVFSIYSSAETGQSVRVG